MCVCPLFFCANRLRHLKNDCTKRGWAVRYWHHWTHSKRCGCPNGNSTKTGKRQYIAKHFNSFFHLRAPVPERKRVCRQCSHAQLHTKRVKNDSIFFSLIQNPKTHYKIVCCRPKGHICFYCQYFIFPKMNDRTHDDARTLF